MADTTTTNLGLTKPEVGASADTWGTKLNTDLDSIDALFAAAGTGTSVGLNVGAGKTIAVAGTLNVTGTVSGGVIATLASPTFTGTVTLPSTTSIGSVSSTELGYLDGVTSSIQTQLNAAITATGTATLTNKTIEAGTFTNGYTEETVTANTGTAYTIDLANGTLQILTLTGNCTFTFPTATAGKSFMLLLKQDGTGSRTVTWPAAVKWPAGTAPTITTTASKCDKFVFTADGTNWLGSNAGQNYTV